MKGYIAGIRELVGRRTVIQCAASIICVDRQGRILLGKRTDNHLWGYSGGSVEIDERVEDCARRELQEETGLAAEEIEFFCVNSGPETHYVYPNGDEVSNVEIVYLCRKYHGELRPQEAEIEELRFFDPAEIDPEMISPPIRPVVDRYLRQCGDSLKLRNMTGIYLSCNGRMLLLFRQGGKVVNNQWIASAGGHFRKDELNDPKACVLRELKEELGLEERDLTDLKMRYIGLRHVGGEIRQNYYFFANLKPEHYSLFTSNEGRCRWVEYPDIMSYEMPLTARYVMEHYLRTGQHTNELYSAVCDGKDFRFVPLREA